MTDLDKLRSDIIIARRRLAHSPQIERFPRVTPEDYDALLEMVEEVRQLEVKHEAQRKRLGLTDVQAAAGAD